MDLQSFIQSGLLEAYVLGQCNPEERAQVERMAALHPEVRAELSAIETALEGYASAHAVRPPEGMKKKIMDRIELESVSTGSKPEKGQGVLRLFQVLCFLLAAAASFLFMQQKDLRREKEQYRIQNDTLQKQILACNNELQQVSAISELLCDAATQRIIVSDGKGLHSIVYYNARLQRSAFDPYSLPAPPVGKYYQFWAIVDGKPVSMGMVQNAENLCETMREVQNAQAFAFSAEDNPAGNAAPTLVLAIGKV
jgi:anti-sigma-K factor RskA